MPNSSLFQKGSKIISKSYSKSTKKPNPTLESIHMVEVALSEMQNYPTKNKLWRNLPRQIQYQSFKVILEYLEESNKIIYDGNSIVWVFSNTPEHEQLQNILQ